MKHQNTKKHKAQHGGYRDKPTKAAVNANLNFWAALKETSLETEVDLVDDELDALFGQSAEKLIKIGTQLKLF